MVPEYEGGNSHTVFADEDVDETTPLAISRPRPDYVKVNTANYWVCMYRLLFLNSTNLKRWLRFATLN